MTLFEKYRKAYEQCFIPIFVKDSFDTDTLIEGCKLAGAEVIEYTLRRENANTVIPNLKEDFGGVVFVGSTIDDDRITLQMKKKNPQLMTLSELAPHVDGFVSMLPYSDETLNKYRGTHILIPTAETSGEALRQIKNGATVIKVLGPDFSFSKKLHAVPTFNYCPTFVTGGVNIDRMPEAFEAGNVMCAAGFDLILKDEDPKTLSATTVAEKLKKFIDSAKAARAAAFPELAQTEPLTDTEFANRLPNYCSII